MAEQDTSRTTRQDLIEFVAQRHGISLNEAKQLVFSVLAGVVYLADHSDYLHISGFGRFENRHRKGRVQTNPIQGEAKVLPPSTVLWFTAAQGLKRVDEEASGND